MKPGFQTRIAETVTTDFRHFKLVRAIELVDADGTRYRLPAGASSDLASVPPEFWPVLPPFGEYALEAYLHDCAYQNTLERASGTVRPACPGGGDSFAGETPAALTGETPIPQPLTGETPIPQPTWEKANLSKGECDGLFLRMMNLNPNIAAGERDTLYHGVVLGGWHAFKEDRA